MMLNHRCSTSMKRGKEKRETQFGAFNPEIRAQGQLKGQSMTAKYDILTNMSFAKVTWSHVLSN